MVSALTWYLAITALGLIAWPLLFRFLPGLPDRGYIMSRAFGLMLVGYVFWLLGSLGFLGNTVGGILFAMLVVAGLGLWAYLSRPDQTSTLQGWLMSHPRVVLVAEVLFLAAFAAWAVFRAHNPDIRYTEKPMELTFLNGVRMSPAFPPRDPWLSGYAISYYYFGYTLVALLADLTGTPSGIAFNLGIALVFALTLLGSYGVAYNLIAARFESQPDERNRAAQSSLFAPLFVGVIGNLVGFLQLVHSRALPFIPASFWTWLDVRDLNVPRIEPAWPPDQWDPGWWWWRASRVINDRNVNGTLGPYEPIDEFPFFSFLLGDMHPHVLAIPFVLVALAFAVNLLRQRAALDRAQMALYAVSLGGLAFLNAWDFPIYLFILFAVMILRAVYQSRSFDARSLTQPVLTSLGIFALGILAYLPWYIGFTSQAGGILPNALFPTRFQQLSVMFGPFLLIIVWLLVDRSIRHVHRMDWAAGAMLSGFVLVILIAVMLVLSLGAIRADAGARAFVASSVLPTLNGVSDSDVQRQMSSIVGEAVRHRLAHPLTPVFLTSVIGLAVALLIPHSRQTDEVYEAAPTPPLSHPTVFGIVLVATAALLTLGPEFVYLRDVFGQRLNTVFKFYYAAWILLAIASSYFAVLLLARPPSGARIVFTVILTVLMAAGLVYPVLAIATRSAMDCRDPEVPATLDGIDYIRRCNPGDYQGILWLQENSRPGDVVLEAVGGQYSYYGRVSMATGIPTLMGWPGHEHQWRGELYGEMAGSRESDIREIYNTHNMQYAKDLLDRYGVTYVFVGSLERSPEFAVPSGLEKFDRFLPIVFQAQGVTIYRADQPLVEEELTP